MLNSLKNSKKEINKKIMNIRINYIIEDILFQISDDLLLKIKLISKMTEK